MSTLTVTNIKKTGETASRGVSGVAAAWVNYNTITTTSINDSFGVASLTDVGTGLTDVNFSNAFVNSSYAGTATANNYQIYIGNTSSAVARCGGTYPSGTGGQQAPYDMNDAKSVYHGDLA